MHGMRDAQGQNIVGILDQDLLPNRVGFANVAIDPSGERIHMHLLARVRGGGERLRLLERVVATLDQMGLLRQAHEITAHALSHDHLGIGLVDVFQQHRRVAAGRQEFVNGCIERVDRLLARSRHLQSTCVFEHFAGPFFFSYQTPNK